MFEENCMLICYSPKNRRAKDGRSATGRVNVDKINDITYHQLRSKENLAILFVDSIREQIRMLNCFSAVVYIEPECARSMGVRTR